MLKEKYNVTVLDSFVYDQNTLSTYCHNKNFKIIKSDIRNFSLIKKIINDFDVIIPLAGLVGAPLCKFNETEAKSINLDANIELFKLIKSKQLIIMPTTNSAYGTGKENQIFNENSHLKPISTYAKHKVIVEKNY